MIKKSLLIWLSIIPLAILNGGLRDKVITPLIGEIWALPLSGVLLCVMVGILCYFTIPRLGKGTVATYRTIGLLWVVLTIGFETGMGLITGESFRELVKAYDITTGNLWLLVVVFVGIAPWLTAKQRKLI